MVGKSETSKKDCNCAHLVERMADLAFRCAEKSSDALDRVLELVKENEHLKLTRERLAEENAKLKQAVFEHEKGGKV